MSESPIVVEEACLDGQPGVLRLDYEQTFETYRQLVDIRFKLLGFVPTLAALAVALLTADTVTNQAQVALGMLGTFVTIGIIVYDQRNTQFHDGAVGRLEYLEVLLGFQMFGDDKKPGLMGSRDFHRRKSLFGIRIKHDIGLALVYGAAIGGWVFVTADGVVEAVQPGNAWLPIAFALVAGVAMAAQLIRMMSVREPDVPTASSPAS